MSTSSGKECKADFCSKDLTVSEHEVHLIKAKWLASSTGCIIRVGRGQEVETFAKGNSTRTDRDLASKTVTVFHYAGVSQKGLLYAGASAAHAAGATSSFTAGHLYDTTK